MAGVIPVAVRLLVVQRAANRCEYCLLHQEDSFTPHQVDHVVSRKHGGGSAPSNLALACIQCNAWKGSDIAGFGDAAGRIVRLFHPRLDRWHDHFRLEGGAIMPLTDVGLATANLLRLNEHGRVSERRLLAQSGRHPRD
jgi:hypothetical protein